MNTMIFIRSDLFIFIVTPASDNVDGKWHGTDDVSCHPTIHVTHGYGSGSCFYALHAWSSPIAKSPIYQSVYSLGFDGTPDTTVPIYGLECIQLS